MSRDFLDGFAHAVAAVVLGPGITQGGLTWIGVPEPVPLAAGLVVLFLTIVLIPFTGGDGS